MNTHTAQMERDFAIGDLNAGLSLCRDALRRNDLSRATLRRACSILSAVTAGMAGPPGFDAVIPPLIAEAQREALGAYLDDRRSVKWAFGTGPTQVFNTPRIHQRVFWGCCTHAVLDGDIFVPLARMPVQPDATITAALRSIVQFTHNRLPLWWALHEDDLIMGYRPWEIINRCRLALRNADEDEAGAFLTIEARVAIAVLGPDLTSPEHQVHP